MGQWLGVAAKQHAEIAKNIPSTAARAIRVVYLPFISFNYAIDSLDAYAQLPLSLFAKTLSKKVSGGLNRDCPISTLLLVWRPQTSGHHEDYVNDGCRDSCQF